MTRADQEFYEALPKAEEFCLEDVDVRFGRREYRLARLEKAGLLTWRAEEGPGGGLVRVYERTGGESEQDSD